MQLDRPSREGGGRTASTTSGLSSPPLSAVEEGVTQQREKGGKLV